MTINGRKLNVGYGSMSEAMALLRAAVSVFRRNGVKINLSGMNGDPVDLENIDLPENTIESVLKNIADFATDAEVERCLFDCAGRTVLESGDGKNAENINRDFFESVENRKHYYPIMLEIARVNLSPFFENLGSMFSEVKEKLSNYLK